MSDSGIFRAAAKLPADQRSAFLDRECGDNCEQRQQIEFLLLAHDEKSDFLEQTAAAAPPLPEMNADRQVLCEGPGSMIGPYKLLQQIGQGGFGVVYMAEQIQPVRRMVALKIIKPGMDTGQVIARFESERQALALMDHPNIAKVLDAGATGSGRPYFVMELVKGVPITDFCDKNHMPAKARLKLFIDVCHAIQHAHHKGVIHRDIKPSNVMVTLHDGVPVVKVIDFGVAKATVQKLTEKTLFTAYGQMIGTPMYMSPEQAEMSGLDIDTRSDIYSLGVLLYELLTGTTPLDLQKLRSAGYVEMQRLIRDEEPPRPSTRLSSLGDSATVMAGNRGSDVKQLAQLLAGDLDWIVMKAIEKDRNRRYDTPGNFAEDVGRYLRGEAILARPVSTMYKLKKLAQRNRTAVLTAGAVIVALLVGTTVAVWQALAATKAKEDALAALAEKETARAAEAEQRRLASASAEAERQAKQTAESREAETRVVLDFVENKILAAARPVGQYGGLGYDVTVRQAIEAALPFVESGFRDQPLIEARLRMSLGWSFTFLGEFKAAADQFQTARAIYTRHLGPDNPDTLRSVVGLAVSYGDLGRRAEAFKLFDETLALQRAKIGHDHSDTLWTMHFLAQSRLRLGRHAEAAQLNEETLALRKAKVGPDHPDTLHSMSNLGLCLGILGRHDEAHKLHVETLALRKARLGPTHPDTLESMSQLAHVYSALKRHAEALRLHQETLALRRDNLGPEHPGTLASMHNVAASLHDLGKHPEALKLREETLPLMKKKLGDDHPHTLWFMHLLADSYDTAGKKDVALKLRHEAVELAKARLGRDSGDTLWIMNLLSDSYAKLGRDEEALKTRREILALAENRHGPDHPDTLFAMQQVAVSLAALRRNDEALKLLQETLARRRAALPPDHPDTIWNLAAVAEILVKLGRATEAVPLIDECVRTAGDKPAHARIVLPVLLMRFQYFKTAKEAAGIRTTAEMWEKQNCTAANCFYNAARMRAITAAVLRATDKSPEAAWQADVEADRAMAWLRKAVAAGFNNKLALAFDLDLNALRGREDFKKLIAEMETAKGKEKK